MAAVRCCADGMEVQAQALQTQLSESGLAEYLRAAARERCAALADAAARAAFELALLRTDLDAAAADASEAVRRLSAIEAVLMSAVAEMTDVVDALEGVAERNERHEPAYVLVVEAIAAMMQDLKQAQAATAALQRSVSRGPPTD